MKWNKLASLFFCLLGISSLSATGRYPNFDLKLIGTTKDHSPHGNLLRKIRSSVFNEVTITSEELGLKPNSMKWAFNTRRRRQEEDSTTIDDSTTAMDASTEIPVYENEIEPPDSTTTPMTPDETTTAPGSSAPTDTQITTVPPAIATTNYERHVPKDPGINLDNFHVHVFKSFVGLLEGIGKVYDTIHRAVQSAWSSVKSFFSKVGSWFSSSKPTPTPPTAPPMMPAPTTPAPTISVPTTPAPTISVPTTPAPTTSVTTTQISTSDVPSTMPT